MGVCQVIVEVGTWGERETPIGLGSDHTMKNGMNKNQGKKTKDTLKTTHTRLFHIIEV